MILGIRPNGRHCKSRTGASCLLVAPNSFDPILPEPDLESTKDHAVRAHMRPLMPLTGRASSACAPGRGGSWAGTRARRTSDGNGRRGRATFPVRQAFLERLGAQGLRTILDHACEARFAGSFAGSVLGKTAGSPEIVAISA
jgi:hypothetical protein